MSHVVENTVEAYYFQSVKSKGPRPRYGRILQTNHKHKPGKVWVHWNLSDRRGWTMANNLIDNETGKPVRVQKISD